MVPRADGEARPAMDADPEATGAERARRPEARYVVRRTAEPRSISREAFTGNA